MAGADRQTPDSVDPLQRLAREPWKFDFFGVMRLLECHAPGYPRIGAGRRGADDVVRVGQEPATTFAPAALAGFRPGTPARLSVHFLGLLGPNGPLPLHITEYVRDRLRNEGDATLARFLDLFNNRMLALFYRAWAGAQPSVCHDRPDSDRFGFYLGTLLGLGPPTLMGRDAFPDLAKLHFAGHLAGHTRHPAGLVSIVNGYLHLPAAVEEFVGHWLRLPASGRSRLGRHGATLGLGLVLGARVWDRQHRFRLRLGPMGLADLERFLPTGRLLAELLALVRNYLGDELEWDLNLVLRREEVPALRLGGGARLGWTTWLGGAARERDADDLTLRPLDYPRVRRDAFTPTTATPTGGRP